MLEVFFPVGTYNAVTQIDVCVITVMLINVSKFYKNVLCFDVYVLGVRLCMALACDFRD